MTDPAATPLPAQGRSASIEVMIGVLLRCGVVVSLVLLVCGSLLEFVQPGGYGTSEDLPRLIGPGGGFPRSIAWMVQGLRELHGQAIIVLGLLMLIATPVLRVAVSIVVFAVQRDRMYVLITSVVLALLVLSFVLGRTAG